MKTSLRSALFITVIVLFNPVYAENPVAGLAIEDAWIAEAPPVSKVMAAYMTILNTAAQDMEIVSAESEQYSNIEFHETIEKNGMAGMLRHDSLHISANSRLELKQGGLHLMLFNPARRLTSGDKVVIKLMTQKGSAVSSTFVVKKFREQ